MPRGYSAWLRCQIAAKSPGKPSTVSTARLPQTGPSSTNARPVWTRRHLHNDRRRGLRHFVRSLRKPQPRSGSASATPRTSPAPAGRDGAPVWNAIQAARRRRRRIQPQRRLLIDQCQQHRGRRIAQWRRCRHAAAPHAPARAAPSRPAPPGSRIARRATGSAKPGARSTLMSASSASRRTAPASPRPSPPGRSAAAATPFQRRDHLCFHCRRPSHGSCISASTSAASSARRALPPRDVSMTDETIIGSHRAARHRHFAQIERRRRHRRRARAPSPGRPRARAKPYRPAAAGSPNSSAISVRLGASKHRHPAPPLGKRMIQGHRVVHGGPALFRCLDS